MGNGVCDARFVELAGSIDDGSLQSGKRSLEGPNAVHAGQVETREEQVPRRSDRQDLGTIWAIAGEERSEPRPQSRGSTRTTEGKTRPVAQPEAYDSVVTAGDLDHVGMQESIVIGDRRHWSRFESGVASELIVLMAAGPYCHE